MKEYPEIHQQGHISIENIPTMLGWDGSYMEGDLGIQIASDGRVWVCIDGVAFLRFKPTRIPLDHSGIGPITSKDLLDRFGTWDNVANASSEELLSTRGVGARVLQKIRSFYPREENQNG